jgi:hypothetical protein
MEALKMKTNQPPSNPAARQNRPQQLPIRKVKTGES